MKLSKHLWMFLPAIGFLLVACNVEDTSSSSTISRSYYTEPSRPLSPHWESDNDQHWFVDADGQKSQFGPHDYVLDVIEEPTFERKGKIRYHCQICDRYTRIEDVDKLEHSYSDEYSHDDNNHWKPCLDEGYEDLRIGYGYHRYGEYTSYVYPSPYQAGYYTHECVVCDYVQTVVIPKMEVDNSIFDFTYHKDFVVDHYEEYYSVALKKISPIQNIIIPDTYNDLPVKHIDGDFLNDNINYVNYLYVSDSINNIPEMNFGVDYVYIGRSVSNITISSSRYFSFGAIDVHPENQHIRTTKGVLIQDNKAIFSVKNKSGTISLVDDNIVEVCPRAFARCSFDEIIFGNGLTKIGQYAFEYSSHLERVVLPDSVTTIENSAFNECRNLKYVTLPQYLTKIPDCAFYYCPIESINFGPELVTIGSNAFRGNCLGEIILPEGVTTILSCAFAQSHNLKKVVLPESLVTMEAHVFESCGTENCEFYIPKNLKDLGEDPFKMTGIGTFFVDPDNDYYLAYEGSLYNKSMTKLISASTLLEGTVTTPYSVTTLENYCFYGCDKIDKVILFNVTNINKAFFNTKIPDVQLPNCLTSLGEEAFAYSWIRSITIPSSVTIIPNSAFENSSLKTITLHNGIVKIDRDAFRETKLESIQLPTSLTEIGSSAFYRCHDIDPIDISMCSHLTTIGAGAFEQCPVTPNLIIPSSVKTIGNYAFYCSGVQSVVFNEGLEYLGSRVFFAATDIKSVQLPSTLKVIGERCFAVCDLSSITIPDSVTTIGYGAFSYNLNLASIHIGSGLKTLSRDIFSNTDITSLVIPDTIETLEDECFGYCKKLASVTIPTSVTTIYDEVFVCNELLTSVSYEGTKEQWNAINFVHDSEKTWYYETNIASVICSDGVISL